MKNHKNKYIVDSFYYQLAPCEWSDYSSPLEVEDLKIEDLENTYSLKELRKLAEKSGIDKHLSKRALSICLVRKKNVFFPSEVGKYEFKFLIHFLNEFNIDYDHDNISANKARKILLDMWRGGDHVMINNEVANITNLYDTVLSMEDQFCSSKISKVLRKQYNEDGSFYEKLNNNITKIMEIYQVLLNMTDSNERRQKYLEFKELRDATESLIDEYLNIIKKYCKISGSKTCDPSTIPDDLLIWMKKSPLANKIILCNVKIDGNSIDFNEGDMMTGELKIYRIHKVEHEGKIIVWMGVAKTDVVKQALDNDVRIKYRQLTIPKMGQQQQQQRIHEQVQEQIQNEQVKDDTDDVEEEQKEKLKENMDNKNTIFRNLVKGGVSVLFAAALLGIPLMYYQSQGGDLGNGVIGNSVSEMRGLLSSSVSYMKDLTPNMSLFNIKLADFSDNVIISHFNEFSKYYFGGDTELKSNDPNYQQQPMTIIDPSEIARITDNNLYKFLEMDNGRPMIPYIVLAINKLISKIPVNSSDGTLNNFKVETQVDANQYFFKKMSISPINIVNPVFIERNVLKNILKRYNLYQAYFSGMKVVEGDNTFQLVNISFFVEKLMAINNQESYQLLGELTNESYILISNNFQNIVSYTLTNDTKTVVEEQQKFLDFFDGNNNLQTILSLLINQSRDPEMSNVAQKLFRELAYKKISAEHNKKILANKNNRSLMLIDNTFAMTLTNNLFKKVKHETYYNSFGETLKQLSILLDTGSINNDQETHNFNSIVLQTNQRNIKEFVGFIKEHDDYLAMIKDFFKYNDKRSEFAFNMMLNTLESHSNNGEESISVGETTTLILPDIEMRIEKMDITLKNRHLNIIKYIYNWYNSNYQNQPETFIPRLLIINNMYSSTPHLMLVYGKMCDVYAFAKDQKNLSKTMHLTQSVNKALVQIQQKGNQYKRYTTAIRHLTIFCRSLMELDNEIVCKNKMEVTVIVNDFGQMSQMASELAGTLPNDVDFQNNVRELSDVTRQIGFNLEPFVKVRYNFDWSPTDDISAPASVRLVKGKIGEQNNVLASDQIKRMLKLATTPENLDKLKQTKCGFLGHTLRVANDFAQNAVNEKSHNEPVSLFYFFDVGKMVESFKALPGTIFEQLGQAFQMIFIGGSVDKNEISHYRNNLQHTTQVGVFAGTTEEKVQNNLVFYLNMSPLMNQNYYKLQTEYYINTAVSIYVKVPEFEPEFRNTNQTMIDNVRTFTKYYKQHQNPTLKSLAILLDSFVDMLDKVQNSNLPDKVQDIIIQSPSSVVYKFTEVIKKVPVDDNVKALNKMMNEWVDYFSIKMNEYEIYSSNQKIQMRKTRGLKRLLKIKDIEMDPVKALLSNLYIPKPTIFKGNVLSQNERLVVGVYNTLVYYVKHQMKAIPEFLYEYTPSFNEIMNIQSTVMNKFKKSYMNLDDDQSFAFELAEYKNFAPVQYKYQNMISSVMQYDMNDLIENMEIINWVDVYNRYDFFMENVYKPKVNDSNHSFKNLTVYNETCPETLEVQYRIDQFVKNIPYTNKYQETVNGLRRVQKYVWIESGLQNSFWNWSSSLSSQMTNLIYDTYRVISNELIKTNQKCVSILKSIKDTTYQKEIESLSNVIKNFDENNKRMLQCGLNDLNTSLTDVKLMNNQMHMNHKYIQDLKDAGISSDSVLSSVVMKQKLIDNIDNFKAWNVNTRLSVASKLLLSQPNNGKSNILYKYNDNLKLGKLINVYNRNIDGYSYKIPTSEKIYKELRTEYKNYRRLLKKYVKDVKYKTSDFSQLKVYPTKRNDYLPSKLDHKFSNIFLDFIEKTMKEHNIHSKFSSKNAYLRRKATSFAESVIITKHPQLVAAQHLKDTSNIEETSILLMSSLPSIKYVLQYCDNMKTYGMFKYDANQMYSMCTPNVGAGSYDFVVNSYAYANMESDYYSRLKGISTQANVTSVGVNEQSSLIPSAIVPTSFKAMFHSAKPTDITRGKFVSMAHQIMTNVIYSDVDHITKHQYNDIIIGIASASVNMGIDSSVVLSQVEKMWANNRFYDKGSFNDVKDLILAVYMTGGSPVATEIMDTTLKIAPFIKPWYLLSERMDNPLILESIRTLIDHGKFGAHQLSMFESYLTQHHHHFLNQYDESLRNLALSPYPKSDILYLYLSEMSSTLTNVPKDKTIVRSSFSDAHRIEKLTNQIETFQLPTINSNNVTLNFKTLNDMIDFVGSDETDLYSAHRLLMYIHLYNYSIEDLNPTTYLNVMINSLTGTSILKMNMKFKGDIDRFSSKGGDVSYRDTLLSVHRSIPKSGEKFGVKVDISNPMMLDKNEILSYIQICKNLMYEDPQDYDTQTYDFINFLRQIKESQTDKNEDIMLTHFIKDYQNVLRMNGAPLSSMSFGVQHHISSPLLFGEMLSVNDKNGILSDVISESIESDKHVKKVDSDNIVESIVKLPKVSNLWGDMDYMLAYHRERLAKKDDVYLKTIKEIFRHFPKDTTYKFQKLAKDEYMMILNNYKLRFNPKRLRHRYKMFDVSRMNTLELIMNSMELDEQIELIGNELDVDSIDTLYEMIPNSLNLYEYFMKRFNIQYSNNIQHVMSTFLSSYVIDIEKMDIFSSKFLSKFNKNDRILVRSFWKLQMSISDVKTSVMDVHKGVSNNDVRQFLNILNNNILEIQIADINPEINNNYYDDHNTFYRS